MTMSGTIYSGILEYATVAPGGEVLLGIFTNEITG